MKIFNLLLLTIELLSQNPHASQKFPLGMFPLFSHMSPMSAFVHESFLKSQWLLTWCFESPTCKQVSCHWLNLWSYSYLLCPHPKCLCAHTTLILSWCFTDLALVIMLNFCLLCISRIAHRFLLSIVQCYFHQCIIAIVTTCPYTPLHSCLLLYISPLAIYSHANCWTLSGVAACFGQGLQSI